METKDEIQSVITALRQIRVLPLFDRADYESTVTPIQRLRITLLFMANDEIFTNMNDNDLLNLNAVIESLYAYVGS